MYDVYGYTSLALMAMQKMGIPVCVEIPEMIGAVIYLYASPNGDIEPSDAVEFENLKQRFNATATQTYKDSYDCAINSEFDRYTLLRGYTLLRNLDVTPASESAGPVDAGLRCRIEEPVK